MLRDAEPASRVRGERENRRAELKAHLDDVHDTPPLLHPGMADLYREKVAGLCQALEREGARTQASEAIRELLDGIIFEPDGQELRILVKGNLASMLRFAPKCETLQIAGIDDLERSISLVAGAPQPTIPYAHLYGGLSSTTRHTGTRSGGGGGS